MRLWPAPSGPSAGLSRYRIVRERMTAMLSECLGTVFADEATATAKALGLWCSGGLIADGEMVRVHVFEATAFHHRRRGETAIERMARTLPADAPALDQMIAAGCLRYRWSIFDVLRVHADEGADLRDTRDGALCRLWDEGAARDLTKGERIAVRLVPVDDWWATSGSAIAGIPEPILDLARTWLPAIWHDPADWPLIGTAERDRLTLTLMAACHPLGGSGQALEAAPFRKQPCPCGSGKKFKHCCGRED